MISKNVKISNQKGVTVCEMGKGDVRVAPCVMPDNQTAGVMFTNSEAHEIGTSHHTQGTTSDMVGIDLLLEFSDEKSIDVVAKALEVARVKLRNVDLIST